ncbi:hypothetical protein ACFL59_10265 [Planctomycetota bacterium]
MGLQLLGVAVPHEGCECTRKAKVAVLWVVSADLLDHTDQSELVVAKNIAPGFEQLTHTFHVLVSGPPRMLHTCERVGATQPK